MGFPERKILEKKDEFESKGYPQGIFEDDYWLYSDGVHPARIEKSASQVICYFNNLFDKHVGHRDFLIGDIGAGAGNYVQQFHTAGYRAEGCEFSESGRRIAKEKFNIDLENCDLRKRLPYEDDHFDWTFCAGVLSMIPMKNMKQALKELLRVTKYGCLINVGTSIANNKVDRRGNPHHLTQMTTVEMWKKIVVELNGYDLTSIQPPQKASFGIGMYGEFCGLFSKSPWGF